MASNKNSVPSVILKVAIKAANKIIFNGIKKILGEANEFWAEELPWVLWAYQTILRSFTGETPFRLAYDTNALILIEVVFESYQNEVFNMENNKFSLRENVDLLEEEREAAHQEEPKVSAPCRPILRFRHQK